MRAFLTGIHRWYLRTFKGIVKPPAGNPQGTTWLQHAKDAWGFTCSCGELLAFLDADLKILSQDHAEGCDGVIDSTTDLPFDYNKTQVLNLQPCKCPITEARYVKICPKCHLGHWKQAK
jgi:hypothetical protein